MAHIPETRLPRDAISYLGGGRGFGLKDVRRKFAGLTIAVVLAVVYSSYYGDDVGKSVSPVNTSGSSIGQMRQGKGGKGAVGDWRQIAI